MKKPFVVALGLCVLVISQGLKADLRSRFQDELIASGSTSCPSKICPSPTDLESYQYIFVDGFMSETSQRNFLPAVRVLQNQWHINDLIVLRPSSFNSIPKNTEILYNTFINLRASSSHKKAIIVAHSKGAAESFLALMHHPDLFNDHGITDLVSIDGCLTGTPLADLWTYLCKNPPAGAMTVEMQSFCQTFVRWDSPLRSMKPSVVKPLVESAISQLSRDDHQSFSKRVWSIEGQWPELSKEWKTFFVIPHLYLQASYGNNDGVIPTANQKYPLQFGQSLGTFETDHGGLTNVADTFQKELVREAFIRAVMREVISNRIHSED